MNQPHESSASGSRPRYGRAMHRDRQHESAHNDASNLPAQPKIEHPLVTHEPGELIVTQAQLEAFLDHLRAKKRFAYDSEFIGELSYFPRLCLIQAATDERIGLIDPMAEIDLAPFWALLSDPSIEKIVHAGEQDIEPVNRLTNARAANIFDTQVCAGFVGLAYPVGLSKLVAELLAVRLGKGLTFTHWDQRPLSPLQLKYAADDVRYLPAIHAELCNRLRALGHESWALEECDALCDPSRYGFDPDTYYLRIRGASGLPPQSLAVLRELTVWRDSAARQHDVPPRAFLKDEILMDMARQPIKSVDRLARVKGLPRPVEAAHGAAIVSATMRGLSVPTDKRPQGKTYEPTPSERFGAESLYLVAAALCAGKSIDPMLVASRQDLSELYQALSSETDLPELRLLNGWRSDACGRELLEIYKGQKQLNLLWRDGRLQAG